MTCKLRIACGGHLDAHRNVAYLACNVACSEAPLAGHSRMGLFNIQNRLQQAQAAIERHTAGHDFRGYAERIESLTKAAALLKNMQPFFRERVIASPCIVERLPTGQ